MFADRYTDESDLEPIVAAVEGACQHLDPDGLCVAKVAMPELPFGQSLSVDVHEDGIDIKHCLDEDCFEMSVHIFYGMDMTPDNFRKAGAAVREFAAAAGLDEDNFDDYSHRVRHYYGNEMEMREEEITP